MIKPLKALGAFLVLLALLGGIPAGLLLFYGNPIPAQLPTGSDIASLLTSRDTIGALLFVLVWIGWIAWATFTLSVAIELIARARHIQAPQIRGLGAQQGAAALLITAIASGLGAPAALADTPTVEAAPVAQTVQAEAPAMPTEQPPTPDHTPAASNDLVITVQAGDTAWDLAEKHLGDGQRWREIVAANDGITQPDGGALRIGQDPYLEPGWTLTVPGVPAVSTDDVGETAQQYQAVTVQPGDSLSSLAQQHLGDQNRWPEIFEASTHITQPGGYHMEDPDQIDVDWTLHVPTGAPSAAVEASQEPAEDVQAPVDTQALTDVSEALAGAFEAMPAPAPAETPAGETAPVAPTTVETPAQSTAPSAESEAEDAFTVPWAGVGPILAASILGAVLTRRLQTQRRRRADQRIPAAATVDLDQIRLTRIEDPTVLEFVDRALRTLSALQLRDGRALPDVRLSRLTPSHLELYAADSHQLPEPFEATEDPATWLLPRTAPLAEDDAIADIVAPYPALVTIGTDSDGNQILVDLEHLAALGIYASARTSMPVMRALTVSLATSQWADDLAITTVGVCPELEDALGSGRISYRETPTELLDHLEAKLTHDQEVLSELGHDSAQHARQAGNATDLWAPEIIIIGVELTLTEKSRLQRIVDAQPQIAVAVISSDQHTDLSEWRMHIESLEAARLEPLGLELAPQHLTDADYDRVLRALNAASTTEPSPTSDDPTAEAIEDTPEPQLRSLPPLRPDSGVLLTATQRDSEPATPTDHPYLRVIGPVEVTGATGPLEEKRLAELTETTAYIHLNPGKPENDFRADLWPTKRVADSTRHQRISRLRKWLGTSTDGEPYIPRATGSDGGYILTDHVTSDWATVEQTAQNRSQATAEQLAEALKLVRGRPFENSSRSRYRWSISIQYRITDTVLDIAHELAQRALDAGDIDTTLWATQQGLLVESLHEQLWRYRLQAAAHDPALHQRITHDLEAQLAAIDDDYDLLPETEALMYTTPAHQIAI